MHNPRNMLQAKKLPLSELFQTKFASLEQHPTRHNTRKTPTFSDSFALQNAAHEVALMRKPQRVRFVGRSNCYIIPVSSRKNAAPDNQP